MITHGYTGTRAYGQSKLAQIVSGFELTSRVPARQVTVNSLHPATFMPTKMVTEEIGYSIDSISDDVAATSRLAIDPALSGVTGRFFRPDPGGQGKCPGLRRGRPRRTLAPQPGPRRPPRHRLARS